MMVAEIAGRGINPTGASPALRGVWAGGQNTAHVPSASRDPQGNLKPFFVCACGLSSKFPFCDGSHKGCSEEPGRLYRYDPVTKAVLDSSAEG